MRADRIPLGRKLLCGAVALSMSVMMTPAIALADDSWAADYSVNTPVSADWVDTTIEGISQSENGVHIATGDGGHAKVAVDGGINAEKDAALVEANGAGTLSELEVGGDIAAGEDDGVDVESKNGGTAKATVNGNIVAGDDVIIADSNNPGSSTDVTVNGNLEAGWYGMNISAYDAGKASVTVNGNVSNTGDHPVADIEGGDGGIVDAIVNGNLSSEADGVYVYVFSDADYSSTEDQTVIKFSVKGDVTAASEGLYFVVDEDENDAIVDVLVTGTVKSDTAGVVISYGDKEPTEATVDLTVWKIETGKDGILVANGFYDDNDDYTYTENEEFAEKIKYIVKVEQPQKGATVSATDAKGNALGKSHDFDYALEGDKVLLKVDLDPGYKITGAYNGDGDKTELVMDDAGNYYVVVPRGGGVYLSVEVALEDYTVKFLGDGGKELASGIYHYGDLPAYKGETPVKAEDENYAYEFVGWAPEIDKVTRNITFRATFKAIEKEQPVPAAKPQTEPSPAAGTLPKLADTEGIPAAVIALLASGAAVFALRTRKSA